MAVPTQLSDLSTTIGSNSPAGTDSTGSPGQLDDYLRAAYGLLAQVNAAKAALASPTFTGTVTIPTPFTLGATSVTATGAQINAACVTYPPSSGVFAATITKVTNLENINQLNGFWIRVGSVVTVSGAFLAETTSVGTCVASITPPVASDFANTVQAYGPAYMIGPTGSSSLVQIQSNDTTNRVDLEWECPGTESNEVISYQFSYQIV